MNPEIALALILDLYSQLVAKEQRIQDLEQALKEPRAADAPNPTA